MLVIVTYHKGWCLLLDSSCSLCLCTGALLMGGAPVTGLGLPKTELRVKRNRRTLALVFQDDGRALHRSTGRTLALTGYALDPPTGLHVCFTAAVRVCG